MRKVIGTSMYVFLLVFIYYSDILMRYIKKNKGLSI